MGTEWIGCCGRKRKYFFFYYWRRERGCGGIEIRWANNFFFFFRIGILQWCSGLGAESGGRGGGRGTRKINLFFFIAA